MNSNVGEAIKKWLIVVGSGLLVYLIPVPAGVKPVAWYLLAAFVSIVIGCIVQPVPIGALTLISITAVGFLGLATISELLAGFSNSTIWLLVSAFLLARGFSKTGLGRRISYLLIKILGDNTLKLGYAIMFSEYVFSPATPSTGARGGALIYPIVKSLSSTFDSEPGPTAKKIGAYLMYVGFQANAMSGCLFFTAMISNPMAAMFAQQAFGIKISWMDWAIAAFVPGTLCMLLIPLLLFYLIPPEMKKTPEAPKMAVEKLSEMGPMTRDEKVMCSVFVMVILLWATATYTKLDATLIALGGGSVLILFRVLSWKDVLSETGAWDCLIWIGVFTTMAGLLSKHGLIAWFGKMVAASLAGIPWLYTLIALLPIALYSHYMFAGLTSHVAALYPAFIAVAGAAGVPHLLAALSLGFFFNFCAGLTHYGSAAAPIYYGAGYISQALWWRTGFIMTLIYTICFLTVGMGWWKIIGLW